VLNHRRSGGAGAGSAMRRRPVVNEHSRIPAIALSPAMACVSKLVGLGEPSAGLSHFRTARADRGTRTVLSLVNSRSA